MNLQQCVAVWKVLLSFALVAVCQVFPDTIGTAVGGTLDDVLFSLTSLVQTEGLGRLMAALMFVHAVQANLGMTLIKRENAIFKQCAMLLAVPAMWVFALLDPSDAPEVTQESYSASRLLAYMVMTAGIGFYMYADRRDSEEKAIRYMECQSTASAGLKSPSGDDKFFDQEENERLIEIIASKDGDAVTAQRKWNAQSANDLMSDHSSDPRLSAFSGAMSDN